jgi:hypothetical protein
VKLGERRECRAPRFFTPSRVSLTPPIHHRLPCDYAIAIARSAQVISTAPVAAAAPGPGYGRHGATVFASCSKRLGQRGVMDAFAEDEES